MNVKNKKIVVTGGGNGVGRELVLELIQKGATVLAVDINEAALEVTRQLTSNSKRYFSYRVDLSDREAVSQFAIKAIADHKTIDGLFNNAGIIQPFIHVSELGLENIEKVMSINFYGTLHMIKAFLPHLLERPEAHIVNVSSMGGFIPVPGQSIYGASKAAVKLLSEGLHAELIDTGVNVSVVIPGGIATDIKKNSGISHSAEKKESKVILTPSKAAAGMIRAMEENKKILYLGKDSKMMHFLSTISPSLAGKLINSVMKSNKH